MLSQPQAVLRRRSRLGEAAEFFHQFVELGCVVIDVFVAILRVEVAGQLGSFVRGNLFRRSLDVVANLIARFVIAATSQCELVRRGAITR